MLKKIDWKSKLTSRKFWAAVIGFITTLLLAFNVSEMEVQQIAGIITAAATLIAYILAEGFVDAKRVESANMPAEINEEGDTNDGGNNNIE